MSQRVIVVYATCSLPGDDNCIFGVFSAEKKSARPPERVKRSPQRALVEGWDTDRSAWNFFMKFDTGVQHTTDYFQSKSEPFPMIR